MHLLFVCTGNLCRSPMAERLLAARVQASTVDERAAFTIGSAGTAATAGREMHPHSAVALTELGVDAGDFHSRKVTADMIRAADLVLTMTRAHRRTVLGLDPLALRRTFTLSEAAALARVSHVGDLTSGPTDGRASSLTARLDRARALRAGGATDDIPDPVAQPLPVHRQVAIRISAELDVMTNLMLSATMTA